MLRSCSILLMGCLSVVAPSQPQNGPLARDLEEQRQAQFSTVRPAEAHLSAFVKRQRVPLYRDGNGAIGQWEEIGPRNLAGGWGGMDNAGRMAAVVVDPTDSRTVYAAGASGGLWKTLDGCRTWSPIADYQASLAYGALALDPFDHRTVYAGTGEPHYAFDSFGGVGMLRSRDGGETWELLGSDVFIGQAFSRIVPNPKRPGFLYASTTGGVYRSTDGGGTWIHILSGATSDLLMDPKDPDTLIAARGLPWGSPANGLYKTHDAGDHWTRIGDQVPQNGWILGRIQMDCCRAFPNVVYVSLYGSYNALYGLYKSTDFGEHWLKLGNTPDYGGGQAWYDNYLTVSPFNPNVVFVGGTSTYRTLDGGDTWIDDTRSYSGGSVHPDHHFLAFDPSRPKTVYLCCDGGLFRSNDLGDTWESACNGIGSVQFEFVDVHPTDKNVAYGGTQDNGTNKYVGTTNWLHVFSGDGGVTRVNPKNPEVVYTEYVNLTICRSNDAGASWFDCTNGIDLREGALFYAPFNLDPQNPDTLVAGTQSVWRSTDGAATWQRASQPLGGLVSALTIAPNNSKVIYAGTSAGNVWVTADTGGHWYNVTAGLTPASVGDICVDPRNARHVYLSQVAWGGNRIWESTDAGGTWSAIGQDLPQVPIRAVALSPTHPDTVFLGTEVGVFVSTDGGSRWERFGTGLANSPVFSVVANAKTGYLTVGTYGRGAWRIKLP